MSLDEPNNEAAVSVPLQVRQTSGPSRVKHVPCGETLMSEGEPATSMFVIERGLVRETHTSRHGRELVLRLLGAGDTFGELGVLDAAGIRFASAIAVEPTS